MEGTRSHGTYISSLFLRTENSFGEGSGTESKAEVTYWLSVLQLVRSEISKQSKGQDCESLLDLERKEPLGPGRPGYHLASN